MRISTSMRWLVVAVSAAMLLAVVAACAGETIEVPGETVVVEKVVTETVEVPGETVVKEVIKEVQVPGETVVVKEEVVKEVMVPGETVVVEKVITETVEVPGETVTVEVVKTVEVPGETVVVEKEVVKTVEVPGETVVVEKEVVKTVEVPGQTVVVTKEVAGPEKVVVKEVPMGYVTDPTTGKAVTAPQYGGTLTYPYLTVADTTDVFVSGQNVGYTIDGVNEKLAYADWGIDREVFDYKGRYIPTSFFKGWLAESWDVSPDGLTYTFDIREGVQWHDKAPMNGRELTADDVVYTYQRDFVLGDFTERPQHTRAGIELPWESIEASDKYTVVMKLKEPRLDALEAIINEGLHWILPPEVIEKYGDYTDWKNVVGTGPIMLTDYVEGVSITYTKNPDYWGFDEKYPENRLPYVDEVRALYMAEESTSLAALRTGKVDILTRFAIKTLDAARSLQKTNPDIEVHPFYFRAFAVFGLNTRNAPFDDIRVRHALQMALDLETINDTYFMGHALWENPAFNGVKGFYTPFEEWPEDLKQYYRYDPEGAEKLLDEAGYPRGADGVRFKADYLHRNVIDLGYPEIAASYFADIGVDVTINIADSATWWATRGEHNYEMIQGDMAHPGGVWIMNAHRTGAPASLEYLPFPDNSVLNAASDAFQAATTVEEQLKASREYDMEVMKLHNQIWGPVAPRFQANQAWVKGFNGEFSLGDIVNQSILVRLWIDSELKEAMGH